MSVLDVRKAADSEEADREQDIHMMLTAEEREALQRSPARGIALTMSADRGAAGQAARRVHATKSL